MIKPPSEYEHFWFGPADETACGIPHSESIHSTDDKDKVTCPRCAELVRAKAKENADPLQVRRAQNKSE